MPDELATLGSLQSATYVARHLYPARGVRLQVMRPRLGNPALLVDDPSFELVFFAAPGLDASQIQLQVSADATPVLPVQLEEPPTCDADRLCRVRARVVDPIPAGRLMELCAGIGAETDCRPGALLRFASVPEPLRLAVVADPHLDDGDPGSDVGHRLTGLLEAIGSRHPPIHLAVVVGDLTHHGRPEEVDAFVSVVREATVPLLTISGNHDFKGGNIGEYLVKVTPFLDHVTELGPYRLIGLNSGPQRSDQGKAWQPMRSLGLEASQVEWLDERTADDDTAEVVFVHHPPWAFLYSVIGSHRQALLDIGARNGISVILAGHTHLNEVYDRAGIPQELDLRCDTAPARTRWPITVITARSTDRTAGYREVVVQPDGSFSWCWVQVEVD